MAAGLQRVWGRELQARHCFAMKRLPHSAAFVDAQLLQLLLELCCRISAQLLCVLLFPFDAVPLTQNKQGGTR